MHSVRNQGAWVLNLSVNRGFLVLRLDPIPSAISIIIIDQLNTSSDTN